MGGRLEPEQQAYEWILRVPLPTYVLRVLDDDVRLVTVNRVASDLNPQIDKLVGQSMLPFYKDRADLLDAIHRCNEQKVEVVIETEVQRFNQVGAKLLLRITFMPSTGRDVVLYYQDVSPKSLTAAALRESEQRYHDLVSALPDGVALLRASDGAVLTCNPAAAAILGHPEGFAVLGRSDLLLASQRLVDANDVPTTFLEISRAAKHGVYELVDVSRSQRRWLRVSTQPLLHGGEGAGFVVLFADSTVQIEAEQALRHSAEQLERALQAGRMGTWEWAPGKNYGSWSENLEHVFHLGKRAPGFESFLGCVYEADRAALSDLAHRIMSGETGEQVEVDCRLVGNDGLLRWARISGRASREHDVIQMRGTVIDITERRRLEEELQRAHRLESIGRLAGGVAHDFNNLLAAIVGSVELMEESSPGELAEDLAVIRHAAYRGRDLTTQLLTFARRQSAELKVVDLCAMIEQVERMVRRLLGDEISLLVEARGEVLVLADAAQLEQVIVNLVINAREAMPHGGRLRVEVTTRDLEDAAELADGTYAVLTVADTGLGMSEATLKNAFEPFFTTKRSGTGLGLATCYGIVKHHQGHIVVGSEPGKGTTFTVYLPLAVELGADVAGSEPPPPLTGHRRVLVVDDNELVLNVTERLLLSLGLEVSSASNADAALLLARAVPFDILVCDIAMPGRSGPDLAAELRLLLPRLRCLFISGYARREDGGHPVPHLRKPFSKAELAEALTRLVALPDPDQSA